VAHRRTDSGFVDVPLNEVMVGDSLVVLPHEIVPVDGIVVEGHSRMDESYLTGEPFEISKTPGSAVLSAARGLPTRPDRATTAWDGSEPASPDRGLC
jgi:cation transport ATPase